MQLELFPDDRQPPCQRHSPTSRAAADAIEPSAHTLRAAVLRYLRGQGSRGATDEEITLALDLNPSTARPRRIELQQAGWVYDSGHTRQTRSGRDAVVWVAVLADEAAS